MSTPCDKQPFYTYRPLLEPKHSFRLLELQPSFASKYDNIRGTLGPAITDGLAQYVALSYVWGPAGDYDLVEIDETPFRVRRNLFNCLAEYSRRIAEPAYLFVDAVCIDQSNTEERSAQVTIMGTIFQHALEVFIWLGADPSDCEPLFRYSKTDLAKLLACVDKDRQLWLQAERIGEFIPAVDTSNLTEAVRLFDLASVSYLSRAWVFQEVLVARQLSINCGHLRASWEHMSTTIQILGKHSILRTYGKDFLAMNALLRPHGRASSVRITPDRSLGRYIFLMRTKQCADIRDRFYSILGLLNNSKLVEVSYTHSTLEVFLNALYYSMRIGAIQGNRGPSLTLMDENLIRHFLQAFELEQQVKLVGREFEWDPHYSRGVPIELVLMVGDASLLKRFAEIASYSAGSANDFKIHTIQRTAYETWARSGKPRVPKFLHVQGNVVPSVVLKDQSLDGLAVFVWLGHMGDEVVQDMVRLCEAAVDKC